jgi:hypothetical protein
MRIRWRSLPLSELSLAAAACADVAHTTRIHAAPHVSRPSPLAASHLLGERKDPAKMEISRMALLSRDCSAHSRCAAAAFLRASCRAGAATLQPASHMRRRAPGALQTAAASRAAASQHCRRYESARFRGLRMSEARAAHLRGGQEVASAMVAVRRAPTCCRRRTVTGERSDGAGWSFISREGGT